MFKFMKKENNIINFVKEADKKVAQAYRSNNVAETKNYVDVNTYRQLRQDITAHAANNDRKYEDESFMTREYEVVEENNDVCVIRRNVIFKALKHASYKFNTGINFAELITVSKSNMQIIAISAVA